MGSLRPPTPVPSNGGAGETCHNLTHTHKPSHPCSNTATNRHTRGCVCTHTMLSLNRKHTQTQTCFLYTITDTFRQCCQGAHDRKMLGPQNVGVTHTHTHARTHARAQARTHARTHIDRHTHTHILTHRSPCAEMVGACLQQWCVPVLSSAVTGSAISRLVSTPCFEDGVLPQ